MCLSPLGVIVVVGQFVPSGVYDITTSTSAEMIESAKNSQD